MNFPDVEGGAEVDDRQLSANAESTEYDLYEPELDTVEPTQPGLFDDETQIDQREDESDQNMDLISSYNSLTKNSGDGESILSSGKYLS